MAAKTWYMIIPSTKVWHITWIRHEMSFHVAMLISLEDTVGIYSERWCYIIPAMNFKVLVVPTCSRWNRQFLAFVTTMLKNDCAGRVIFWNEAIRHVKLSIVLAILWGFKLKDLRSHPGRTPAYQGSCIDLTHQAHTLVLTPDLPFPISNVTIQLLNRDIFCLLYNLYL